MDIQTALALLRQTQPSPAPPLEPPPPAPPLSGRALRFVLLDELMRRREMTVTEMVTVVAHQHGFDLSGRASKVISDALRWEIRRGRVVRLGRGRYRFARTSRATARRVAILAQRCRSWIVATKRQETPPTTPRPHRPTARPTWRYHPGAAPWDNLAWLRDI